MRIRPNSIGVCLVGSFLLLLAAGNLGCAGLARLWGKGERDAQAPPPIREHDAVILARLEAKSKGVLIEPYDISTQQKKDLWWVQFKKEPPEGIKGRRRAAKKWPYRFVVEVSSSGTVRLLKEL